MEELTEDFYDTVQDTFHIEWLSTALTILVMAVIAAIVAHALTKLLRKALTHEDAPLPSSSIFINIGRAVVWLIAASVVLSTCFGIDVTGAMTALGIGGLAISLGFQDTLSNLISGLQLSLIGLISPGDRIEIGGRTGVVHDMTWRHTCITTITGERVYVPNSVLNTTTLQKLDPVTTVRVPVVVSLDGSNGTDLEQVTDQMENVAKAAVETLTSVELAPKIHYTEITDYGFKGTLTFGVPAEYDQVNEVRTRVLKAVAPLAHGTGESARGLDA